MTYVYTSTRKTSHHKPYTCIVADVPHINLLLIIDSTQLLDIHVCIICMYSDKTCTCMCSWTGSGYCSYAGVPLRPPLCDHSLSLSHSLQAGYIFSSTGQTLAFAVLLVKNWRLYKIFYNSTLKRDVSKLKIQWNNPNTLGQEMCPGY